jgi:hypothetical protein
MGLALPAELNGLRHDGNGNPRDDLAVVRGESDRPAVRLSIFVFRLLTSMRAKPRSKRSARTRKRGNASSRARARTLR